MRHWALIRLYISLAASRETELSRSGTTFRLSFFGPRWHEISNGPRTRANRECSVSAFVKREMKVPSCSRHREQRIHAKEFASFSAPYTRKYSFFPLRLSFRRQRRVHRRNPSAREAHSPRWDCTYEKLDVSRNSVYFRCVPRQT